MVKKSQRAPGTTSGRTGRWLSSFLTTLSKQGPELAGLEEGEAGKECGWEQSATFQLTNIPQSTEDAWESKLRWDEAVRFQSLQPPPVCCREGSLRWTDAGTSCSRFAHLPCSSHPTLSPASSSDPFQTQSTTEMPHLTER